MNRPLLKNRLDDLMEESASGVPGAALGWSELQKRLDKPWYLKPSIWKISVAASFAMILGYSYHYFTTNNIETNKEIVTIGKKSEEIKPSLDKKVYASEVSEMETTNNIKNPKVNSLGDEIGEEKSMGNSTQTIAGTMTKKMNSKYNKLASDEFTNTAGENIVSKRKFESSNKLTASSQNSVVESKVGNEAIISSNGQISQENNNDIAPTFLRNSEILSSLNLPEFNFIGSDTVKYTIISIYEPPYNSKGKRRNGIYCAIEPGINFDGGGDLDLAIGWRQGINRRWNVFGGFVLGKRSLQSKSSRRPFKEGVPIVKPHDIRDSMHGFALTSSEVGIEVGTDRSVFRKGRWSLRVGAAVEMTGVLDNNIEYKFHRHDMNENYIQKESLRKNGLNMEMKVGFGSGYKLSKHFALLADAGLQHNTFSNRISKGGANGIFGRITAQYIF